MERLGERPFGELPPGSGVARALRLSPSLAVGSPAGSIALTLL